MVDVICSLLEVVNSRILQLLKSPVFSLVCLEGNRGEKMAGALSGALGLSSALAVRFRRCLWYQGGQEGAQGGYDDFFGLGQGGHVVAAFDGQQASMGEGAGQLGG